MCQTLGPLDQYGRSGLLHLEGHLALLLLLKMFARTHVVYHLIISLNLRLEVKVIYLKAKVKLVAVSFFCEVAD